MPVQACRSASPARRADRILIALFLAILAVPGLGLLVGVDSIAGIRSGDAHAGRVAGVVLAA